MMHADIRNPALKPKVGTTASNVSGYVRACVRPIYPTYDYTDL